MTVYQIRDWDKHYETYETRKLKRLTWLPVTNKLDGRGLRRLLRFQQGPAYLGVWLLVLQVASRMPQRGLLVDDDGVALTAVDISDKVGVDKSLIEKALEVLSSPDIGWICCNRSGSQEDAGNSQRRIEGNGMEGNRTSSLARAREDSERDGQVFCRDLANELHAAHAESGLVPGALHMTEHALAQILAGEIDWASFRRRVLASHEAFMRVWQFAPNRTRIRVSVWLSSGEWVHAPSAPTPTAAEPIAFDRRAVPR